MGLRCVTTDMPQSSRVAPLEGTVGADLGRGGGGEGGQQLEGILMRHYSIARLPRAAARANEGAVI